MAKERKSNRSQSGDMRSPSRMAWLLFALAIVPFGLGTWGCYHGWQTLGWPTTEARILSSDARRIESERRDNDRTVTDVRHTVSIRYSYSVGGREYLGEGIQPYSYGMQNSAVAREQSEHYRPDMAVRVAYHPNDPSEAYLEPGLSSVSKMLLAIGIILAIAGFWIRSISKRATQKRAQA
jgi:hypothetical protein